MIGQALKVYVWTCKKVVYFDALLSNVVELCFVAQRMCLLVTDHLHGHLIAVWRAFDCILEGFPMHLAGQFLVYWHAKILSKYTHIVASIASQCQLAGAPVPCPFPQLQAIMLKARIQSFGQTVILAVILQGKAGT